MTWTGVGPRRSGEEESKEKGGLKKFENVGLSRASRCCGSQRRCIGLDSSGEAMEFLI
jgi:hypothetical protein